MITNDIAHNADDAYVVRGGAFLARADYSNRVWTGGTVRKGGCVVCGSRKEEANPGAGEARKQGDREARNLKEIVSGETLRFGARRGVGW